MARWNLIVGFSIAVLAAVAGFVYSNFGLLSTFYTNRPGSLKSVNLLPNTEVRFQDVVRNCEDAYMSDSEGWAILSCDPGRDKWNTVMGTFIDPVAPPETGLYLYRYGTGASAVPRKLSLVDFNAAPGDFHPLGIEYIPQSRTLFVVNHAQSGTRIERFRFYPESEELKHVGSIQHPILRTPNSIAALSASSLLVTNDHHFRRRDSAVLATMETYLALPFASLVRIDLDITAKKGPPNATLLAFQPFANGVATLNKTAIAVASSTGAAIYIYTSASGLFSDDEDVTLSTTVDLQFIPDNLSVDGNGVLFIAGHPHAPSLNAKSQKAAACNAEGASKDDCAKAASWIASWTVESGLEDLYVGDDFETATTAVWDVDRRVGFAVGLYDKGILTFKETES